MAARDFPPRPQGATPDSVPYQNWLDALGQRQNIDLQQELTSVDSADEVMIFDASETGPVKTKKTTVGDVLSARTVQTIQKFKSSGTYTKPPGLRAALVYVKGGGGGGGGSSSAAANGGGGGEGEECWALISGSSIGASETVTIGAGGSSVALNTAATGGTGGTTSFGALLTAVGGVGGTRGNFGGAGGLGGTGGSGFDWAFKGCVGQVGSDAAAAIRINSGGGGKGASTTTLGAALANNGGGGGGGTTAAASGAGGSGLCVVIEYY